MAIVALGIVMCRTVQRLGLGLFVLSLDLSCSLRGTHFNLAPLRPTRRRCAGSSCGVSRPRAFHIFVAETVFQRALGLDVPPLEIRRDVDVVDQGTGGTKL